MQDRHSDLLSLAAAAAAGALFMYYLDAKHGARRRAMVRDKVVSTANDAAELARHKAQHAANRMKGMAANLRRRAADASDGARAHEGWNEQGL